MEYIGNIPFDPQLDELIYSRVSLLNLKETPAVDAITQILKSIGG